MRGAVGSGRGAGQDSRTDVQLTCNIALGTGHRAGGASSRTRSPDLRRRTVRSMCSWRDGYPCRFRTRYAIDVRSSRPHPHDSCGCGRPKIASGGAPPREREGYPTKRARAQERQLYRVPTLPPMSGRLGASGCICAYSLYIDGPSVTLFPACV